MSRFGKDKFLPDVRQETDGGKVMKTILKLYKMFYRLLRLKHWQRREIETKMYCEFLRCQDNTKNERDRLQQEVFQWEHMARIYGAITPKELEDIIDYIVVEHRETRKRNCLNCVYSHEIQPINMCQMKVFCKLPGHWLTWNLNDKCTSFIDKKEAK